MKKKRLDEHAIMNELSDSAFFRQPDQRAAEAVTLPRDVDRGDAPAVSEPQSTRTGRTGSTAVQPVRPVRVMKSRHPFDIYQDQLTSLQRLSAEERMQGGLGSMSKMVRDAIDAYLARRDNASDE